MHKRRHKPMTRRDFLKTSCGFSAMAIAPGLWSCSIAESKKIALRGFETYRPGNTLGTVTCVTPDDGFYLHTFYDVCPFSPSQRYLAVTKLPYQEKKPSLGDVAEVCIIDLKEEVIETIYATRAWSFQLGANVQWGNSSDRFVYTNDVVDGRAVCVRIDRETREVVAFSGPKYDIAPDESFVIGGKLEYMNAAQYGYGIPDGPSGRPNYFTAEDVDTEGIWKTDLKKNETHLLVSFRSLSEHLDDPAHYKGGTFYSFHTKVNRNSDRVMQVLRCRRPDKKGGRNSSLFTFNADGSDIVQTLSRAEWTVRGELGGAGNHPNWHPDGEHIVMNLVPKSLGYRKMRFCMFKPDGSDLRVLSERHFGSGHPSVDRRSKYLIADSYPKQKWATSVNGEIPIRLIDLTADQERTICTVSVDVGASRYDFLARVRGGSQFKLDPHPAWSRDYKKVCFNGAINGIRRVFVADLSGVV